MNPSHALSTRRLKHIGPLHLGKMTACLYGAMGLLLIPFFLLMATTTANLPTQQRGIFAIVEQGFPIITTSPCAAMGFNICVIGAALYNTIAKWIGGSEADGEFASIKTLSLAFSTHAP